MPTVIFHRPSDRGMHLLRPLFNISARKCLHQTQPAAALRFTRDLEVKYVYPPIACQSRSSPSVMNSIRAWKRPNCTEKGPLQQASQTEGGVGGSFFLSLRKTGRGSARGMLESIDRGRAVMVSRGWCVGMRRDANRGGSRTDSGWLIYMRLKE